jgi:hypothetical protein
VASRVASTANAAADGKSAKIVSDLRAGNPKLMSTSPTATSSIRSAVRPAAVLVALNAVSATWDDAQKRQRFENPLDGAG